MIVINSKRIKLILVSIFLGVFAFSFQIAEKEELPKYTLETVSTPVSGKTVILDAGHGYPDLGASSDNGVSESEINLSIVLKIQSLLEQSGCNVILTRSDENGIYDLDKSTLKEKKVSDLKNRVKIGNESSADIFVSIHLNKIDQEKYWGWQTFFKQNNDESIKLATNIQNSLNDTIQKENGREPLKLSNIYIMDNVEIPTSIVECGFLSNNEEEKLLQEDEYQNKLAWGIYMGINDYFYN